MKESTLEKCFFKIFLSPISSPSHTVPHFLPVQQLFTDPFTRTLHKYTLFIIPIREPGAHLFFQLKGPFEFEALNLERLSEKCRPSLLFSSLMEACLLGTDLH